MEEKRRTKRLDLDVKLALERLDEDEVTMLKFVDVEVTDISKGGLGFMCEKELEVGSYYTTRLQIWTKEIINTIISIVRREKDGDMYHYGSIFIGMLDTDALKIDIYQMFNEL